MFLDFQSLKTSVHALVAFYIVLASAVSSEKPLGPIRKAVYTPGQAIPVSCLNRTM
jgi:hypothetical protein